MQFFSLLSFAIIAVSIARCAPALDAGTFSDNAKQAQQLNAQFANLTLTDPCQGQETACVDGDIASCVNGKFDISNGLCPHTLQCFAIPNTRTQGTSLLCTSKSTVLALMNAAGVSGGITGSDNDVSTSTTSSFSTSYTSTSSSTSSTGSPSGPTPVTVTVTMLASSVSTTTTTTVSPSDAISILSKFLEQPPATTSSSVPSLTSTLNPNNSSPSPSIIVTLTPAGDSTNPTPSTSSGIVIQLTAAPDISRPSASTPTPSPSVPGYGY